MFFLKNKVMHSSKHPKLIRLFIILGIVVFLSILVAFSWQKYDEKKHPEGNETNYSLPNAFVDFFELIQNYIEEHSPKEEVRYVTETDENGNEKVVKIIVGQKDNPGEEPEIVDEPIIIEDHGGIAVNSSLQGDSEFSHTLFIGDYFAYNVQNYCFKNASYAYVTGYDLNYILNKKLIPFEGSYYSLPEYIGKFKDIDRVYVTFSAESISWMDTSTFVLKFQSLLDSVNAIYDDVTIFVMPILPINEEMAAKREYTVTNEKINEINSFIKDLTLEREMWYLDMENLFRNETGGLSEEATTNGIRLTEESYTVWKEYIQNHNKIV